MDNFLINKCLTGLEVRMRLVQADLRLMDKNAFPETAARMRGQVEAYEATVRELTGQECAERVASGPLGAGALRLGTRWVTPEPGRVWRGCKDD